MGKAAKYVVRLTDEERQTLQQLVAGPRVARDKALRARMLLKADGDGPGWSDGQLADAFDVGVSTIHRVRRRAHYEHAGAAFCSDQHGLAGVGTVCRRQKITNQRVRA